MKSLILNGAMRFDQVNEGAAYYSSAIEKYSLDQWRYSAATTANGSFKVERALDAPAGFQYSLKVTSLGAKTTASGDFDHIEHAMEGQKIIPYQPGAGGAACYCLQFWVKASITGDYSINLMEGRTNSASIVKKYTVSTANTWEHKIVKFAAPTVGTWTLDRITGFKALWDLGSGSDVTTSSLDVWNTVAAWRAPSTVGLTEHNGATLQLTGVQLDPISLVSDPAPDYINHDYYEELRALQTYFWKTFNQGTPCAPGQGYAGAIKFITPYAPVSGGAGNGVYVPNPVIMGAFLDPTSGPGTDSYKYYNPTSNNALWYNMSHAHDSGAPVTWPPGEHGAYIQNPMVLGDSSQDIIAIHMSVNARLGRN